MNEATIMKKTVYVCGDEEYRSNCEISYKMGGARHDNVDAFDDIVKATMEYLRVMARGKVVP